VLLDTAAGTGAHTGTATGPNSRPHSTARARTASVRAVVTAAATSTASGRDIGKRSRSGHVLNFDLRLQRRVHLQWFDGRHNLRQHDLWWARLYRGGRWRHLDIAQLFCRVGCSAAGTAMPAPAAARWPKAARALVSLDDL